MDLVTEAMETKTAVIGGMFTRFGYFQVLSHLVRRPRIFFQNLPNNISFAKPLTFLGLSCLIPGLAGLIQSPDHRLFMAFVFFANAFFLPLIGAVMGLPAAAILMKGQLPLRKYFSVFALAGGAIGPIAWLPAFSLATESIKWILIGLGLVHGCKMKPRNAFLTILSAVTLTYLLFKPFI